LSQSGKFSPQKKSLDESQLMGLLAFRLGSFILGSPIMPNTHILTKGVSYCGLGIYIKMYLKAKEGLWKGKYFTMQKYNLQNIL
jgi:hypothetical protein